MMPSMVLGFAAMAAVAAAEEKVELPVAAAGGDVGGTVGEDEGWRREVF